jgi:hypothetical protein
MILFSPNEYEKLILAAGDDEDEKVKIQQQHWDLLKHSPGFGLLASVIKSMIASSVEELKTAAKSGNAEYIRTVAAGLVSLDTLRAALACLDAPSVEQDKEVWGLSTELDLGGSRTLPHYEPEEDEEL